MSLNASSTRMYFNGWFLISISLFLQQFQKFNEVALDYFIYLTRKKKKEKGRILNLMLKQMNSFN